MRGFVLLTVLVFLQIFSLISLYSLTTVSAMMKSNDHLWQSDHTRLKSHAILQRLESTLTRDISACSIPLTPATVLAKKSLVWWQLHACHGKVNHIEYYYTIESLGNDPCAIIEMRDGNPSMMATYYRMTLYALPYPLKSAHFVLQTTVALSTAHMATCEQKVHLIKQGRQGFREI